MPQTMKVRRPLARNCWNSGVSQHEKSSFSSQRVGGMTFMSASLSTGSVAGEPLRILLARANRQLQARRHLDERDPVAHRRAEHRARHGVGQLDLAIDHDEA